MASPLYRLTALAPANDADPAGALSGHSQDAATVGEFDGLQVATGTASVEPDPELTRHYPAGLVTAWRARQADDRTVRAVVLGSRLSGPGLAGLVGELHSHGLLVTGLRTLSPTFAAVELALEGAPVAPADLTRQLQGPAEAAGVDLAVLPPAGEAPDWGLLMMDMDSTLLAVECIDEIADHAGVKDQVATITERAMNGELDFKGSLIERVKMLADLDEQVLEAVYRERIRTNPGAERLLAAAKGLGIRVAVVSGGFTFFTERLERDLGLDFTNANVLETDSGRLTGQVLGDIVDGAVKAATLRDLRDQLGLSRDQLIAMGDGANDLAMIAEAGLGVAYHAKPRVRAEAPYNLVHSPLDGLLYFLGLSDADIDALGKQGQTA